MHISLVKNIFDIFQIKQLISQEFELLLLKMGAELCSQNNTETSELQKDMLKIQYAEDASEKNATHSEKLKCSNKELQKILDNFSETLATNRTLYKDPMFSSEPIILRSADNSIKCTYERPSHFLNDVPPYRLIDYHDCNPDTVFVHDEVMQFFGVFLCFLANKPNLIKKIILTEQNTYGIHSVEAYVNGLKRFVVLDDYILCKEEKPLFCQPCKMIYMWTCILEKAWLKIRGHPLKRVEETPPEDLFDMFLPLPVCKITLEELEEEKLKETVEKTFSKKESKYAYIIKTRKQPKHLLGISGKKYFYLLTTFMHENKRLFYVRNPCGRMSFRGVFNSVPETINKLLEQRNYIKITQGNFILDQEQFVEQISQILVVHYIPGNEITSVPFHSDNNEEFFFGFELKHKGTLSLWIHQERLNEKSKKYYPITYQVVKVPSYELIGGTENNIGCFGVKNTHILDHIVMEMLPGKFIIRIKKKQTEKISNINTFILGYFATGIKFDIASQEEMYTKWKQYLMEEGKRALSSESKKHTSEQFEHIIYWLGDLALMYIVKTAKKDKLNLELSFPSLVNLQCISHPQINNSDFTVLCIENSVLIIFEKKQLTQETHINKYTIESY